MNAQFKHFSFKLLLMLCIISILAMILPTTALAKGNGVSNITQQQIVELISKYGFKVTDIENSKISFTNFNDLKSLERYLSTLRLMLQEKEAQIVEITLDSSSFKASTLKSRNSSMLLSNPIDNGLFHTSWYRAGLFYSNIDATYTAELSDNHWHIISINSISHYLTGLVIACTWVQTGSWYNLATTTNYNDTAYVYVSGYLLFGVKFGDFEIGISYPETLGIGFILVS